MDTSFADTSIYELNAIAARAFPAKAPLVLHQRGDAVQRISRIQALAGELKLDVFTIDFEILAFLFGNGPSGIEEIRRNVRGSPGAVSYKIRAMTETGLVIRRTDNKDRRTSFYELADRTAELLDELDGNAPVFRAEAA